MIPHRIQALIVLMLVLVVTDAPPLWSECLKVHDVNVGSRKSPVPPCDECLFPQAIFGTPTNTVTTLIQSGSAAEPTIAVNPKNSKNIVACWQQGRINNGGALEGEFAFTKNGGKTWHRTVVPLQNCIGGIVQRISDVWLSFAKDGSRVYLCALVVNATQDINTQNQSGVIVSISKDGGENWSQPHFIASSPFYLNEPTGLFPFDDKNSITADPNHSRNAYAVWDRFPLSLGNHSDTFLSMTKNGGKTWSPFRLIYNPFPDLTAHNQSNGIENDCLTINNVVVVLPERTYPQGDLLNFMVRLYAKPGATDDQYLNDVFPYQFTLFDIALIRSLDQGLTWTPNANIVTSFIDAQVFTGGYTYNNGQITGGVGTLLRTGDVIPGYNVNPKNGNLYVVWQTGQFRADQLPQIALSTSRDGGLTWSSPALISRTPLNAPNAQAFTPFVAVTKDGLVGVLYSDFRNDNKNDPNNTKTDTWLVIYKEVSSGGSTGIGLDFVKEYRLSKKSYIAQNGPQTTQGVMTNGDYSFLVTHDNRFYGIYTKPFDGPFHPTRTILNDPTNFAIIELDDNYRQAPFVSIIDP